MAKNMTISIGVRPRAIPGGHYSNRYSSIADYLLNDPNSPFVDFENDPNERVYFIGPEDGPIKIGRSNCVQARHAALQSCSPVKLKIHAVAIGGHGLERAYHNHFAHSRLHGEWFELTDQLRREMKRHAYD